MKFALKNAELVEDSDIGPENSVMTLYQLGEFLWSEVLKFVTRISNILTLVIFILTLVTESSTYNSIPSYVLLIILGISFLVQIVFQGYFFMQVRNMEERWNECRVEKLKSGKGRFQQVKIGNLNIGDLVLVKNKMICPVDVLVVATSE